MGTSPAAVPKAGAAPQHRWGQPSPTITLPEPFEMRHGGLLPRVHIAYETWGTLNPEGSNALLLFTGLSPRAHARSSAADPSPGWWEAMIGPGQPIDTDRWFVVCVNHLGSCFGSTGPASPREAEVAHLPGRPPRWGLDFPVLTIEDIARAAHGALEALSIERLGAVVGPSMGGMVALAYALQYPDEVDDLVLISSAAHASPFAIAVHSLQRESIRSDPDWAGGHYDPAHPPQQGMQLARKLGMITYRSAQEWDTRFGRERTGQCPDQPFGPEFEVESYLDHHAGKFVGAFDPNCYLYLSRAMDLFDASEHGGDLDQAMARLQIKRALVVGVHTDILFPLSQQEALADAMRRQGHDVQCVALNSIQGHDAFLVDMDRFRPVIHGFLNP
ncbi:MAG: homoserine O-acetyltransferase [Bradymonadia bacterium]